MSNRRMMVDIETLGSSEDALVLSIGAVIFNAEEVLHDFYVNVDPYTQSDRKIETSNVMWWLQQSDEARGVLFDKETHPSQALIIALAILEDFYDEHKPQEVWANPPTFDLSIIRHAWMTKYEGKDVNFIWPWKQQMCFRTAMRLAPIHIKREKGPGAHNALEDARRQAQLLIDSEIFLVKGKK